MAAEGKVNRWQKQNTASIANALRAALTRRPFVQPPLHVAVIDANLDECERLISPGSTVLDLCLR